ncbi:hypothetical protein JCM3770_007200, partial [Rhodotorula araucariae]
LSRLEKLKQALSNATQADSTPMSIVLTAGVADGASDNASITDKLLPLTELEADATPEQLNRARSVLVAIDYYVTGRM